MNEDESSSFPSQIEASTTPSAGISGDPSLLPGSASFVPSPMVSVPGSSMSNVLFESVSFSASVPAIGYESGSAHVQSPGASVQFSEDVIESSWPQSPSALNSMTSAPTWLPVKSADPVQPSTSSTSGSLPGLNPSVSQTLVVETGRPQNSWQPGSHWPTPEFSPNHDTPYMTSNNLTGTSSAEPPAATTSPISQTSPTPWPISVITVTVTVTATTTASLYAPVGQSTNGVQCSCISEPTRTPPLYQNGSPPSSTPNPHSVSPSATSKIESRKEASDSLGDFDSSHGGLHWPGDYHTWQF